jgi:hypothetical protein
MESLQFRRLERNVVLSSTLGGLLWGIFLNGMVLAETRPGCKPTFCSASEMPPDGLQGLSPVLRPSPLPSDRHQPPSQSSQTQGTQTPLPSGSSGRIKSVRPLGN